MGLIRIRLILKQGEKAFKKGFIPFFMFFSLAQRKELKETSTLSKAFPYMGRMQFEIAETADFKGFGIAREACALKGERWVLSTTLDAGRLTLVD